MVRNKSAKKKGIGNVDKKKDNNKWSIKKKQESFSKVLTRNILEKTYDGTAVAFIILKAIGTGPLGAFFKPTYYVDDPSEFLGEIADFKQRRIDEKAMRATLRRLQGYGFIDKQGRKYLFTRRGEQLAKKILGYKKRLEEKWDGKYRVVIFDIPEAQRQHRNWLRGELYFLGYEKLQNSVFISEMSLTAELIKEIKERDIEECVNYLLVEHVYDLEKMLF
jgi:CRISPR-associated endonuclease Cas2